MMWHKIIIFGFLGNCLLTSSCNYSTSKVVFALNRVSVLHDAQRPALDFNSEEKIWFYDGCYIFERTVLQELESDLPDDQQTLRKREIFKYTYFDYRSGKYQEYEVLSDTASPFCNYFLDSAYVQQLNSERRLAFPNDSLFYIGDTVLDAKRLKIFERKDWGAGGYKWRYFLDCRLKLPNAFMSVWPDSSFPYCSIIRRDCFHQTDSALLILDLKVLEIRNSREIKNVFAAWRKNASITKLPLLTYKESLKSCIPPNNLRRLQKANMERLVPNP